MIRSSFVQILNNWELKLEFDLSDEGHKRTAMVVRMEKNDSSRMKKCVMAHICVRPKACHGTQEKEMEG